MTSSATNGTSSRQPDKEEKGAITKKKPKGGAEYSKEMLEYLKVLQRLEPRKVK